jgi:putative aldouronate transport system permease protein
MAQRRSPGETAFDVANVLLLTFAVVVTLYPILYVAFASISDPIEMMKYRGILLAPRGFDLQSYERVITNPMVGYGYRNTLFVVIVGTTLNLLMTTLAAYALSRKRLYFKNFVMFLITFTMFFSGGLIPTYLLVRMTLGLKDNLLSLILPTAMNAYNMIIMRTSLAAIPDSMEESAKIDGANDFTVLFRIIVPLSLPVIAVMILFYSVAHWNAWFSAMLYIDKRELFPLQLALREILIANATNEMMTNVSMEEKAFVGETIKYATIMVATLPILCVYPFLQRYFVQGVMIGAIKE